VSKMFLGKKISGQVGTGVVMKSGFLYSHRYSVCSLYIFAVLLHRICLNKNHLLKYMVISKFILINFPKLGAYQGVNRSLKQCNSKAGSPCLLPKTNFFVVIVWLDVGSS
jgi:hypothetical protein